MKLNLRRYHKNIAGIIAFFLIFLMSNTLKACAICGCSAGFMGLGYVPETSLNLVGIRYIYAQSRTRHPMLFDDDVQRFSSDYFHTVELSGRYAFNSRLFVNLSLPYHYNLMDEEKRETIAQGIGDPLIAVYYKLYEGSSIENPDFSNMLLVGGGVQLPFGRTDIYLDNGQWAPNLQPGKGAVGLWLNASYSLLNGNFGLFADASAMFYSTSKAQNYRFGPQFTGTITGFYSIFMKSIRLVPQVGASITHKAQDLVNAEADIVNAMSGGSQVDALLGINLYTEYTIWRLQFKEAIYSNLSDGYVNPGKTLSLQFFYILH